MGDIADAIVEGEICQICCCPFEQEQGFPCPCLECGGDVPLYKGDEDE